MSQRPHRRRFFASVGYTNTRFEDFVDAGQDFSGNEFPNAPPWTLAFGGRHVWPSGISLGVDVAYTGASFLRPDNNPAEQTDERFLVNAQLTYEENGWLAGVYVRNLLDETYLLRRQTPFNAAPALGVVGEPRTVGAYVQRDF